MGDTWGILPGLSYPYLLSRFPNGPLVVSGFVGGTPSMAAVPVGLAAGGSIRDTSYSGANGYYYVATDPLTGPAPQGVTAFLNFPTRLLLGSSTTDAPIGPGAVTGLDVLAGQALVRTTQPTASGTVALLSNTGDSRLSPNIPYTTGGSVFFSSGVNLVFQSLNPGGFTLDDTIVANGNVLFTTLGPLTITSGSLLQSQTGDVVASVPQFLNFGGPNAIQAAGRFLLYSISPFLDFRGGLGGGTLFGRPFAAFPPETIGEPGSQVIYATSFPVIPPNFVTVLPTDFTPLTDPPDIIDIALPGGGGGPTLGIGLGTEERSVGTLDYVERISSELERQVAECEREFETKRADTQGYVTCVGNALETYADALDRRVIDLPQPLRGISAVIRETARRVRAARTISEARAAVRTAIGEVRKAIALLRADEPAVARLQVRQGNRIETALQSVENRLAKAVGL